MPGADRDGLTAGPADRLQAVGGAIVALDSGLGHMSEGSDELQSGTLAAGGSVAGNIYFDGDIKKALYFANMFDKSATASWVLA